MTTPTELGLDLLHEVVAELPAGAVGERPDARLGDFVRRGRIAFLIQDAGPFVPRRADISRSPFLATNRFKAAL